MPDDRRDGPASATVTLEQILKITNELFPGLIEVETEFDPDFPDEHWSTLKVESDKTSKELLEAEMVWHQRVLKVTPDYTSHLRLCIFPK